MKRPVILIFLFSLVISFACQKTPAEKRVQASAPAPRYITQIIVDERVSVPSMQDTHYPLLIQDKASLSGDFRAEGGSGNDIQVLVMDEDNYINWKNGHEARVYYDSGKITIGKIDLTLAPGKYYLVFSNRFALLFGKKLTLI